MRMPWGDTIVRFFFENLPGVGFDKRRLARIDGGLSLPRSTERREAAFDVNNMTRVVAVVASGTANIHRGRLHFCKVLRTNEHVKGEEASTAQSAWLKSRLKEPGVCLAVRSFIGLHAR